MIRLFYLTDSVFLGGDTRTEVWLLEDLDRERFAVTAVTSPKGAVAEWVANIPGLDHHRVDFGVPVGDGPRPLAASLSLARLSCGLLLCRQLAHRLGPQIVFTGDRTRAMLAALACASSTKARIVYHPQFFYSPDFRNARLKRFTARRADLVVTNSHVTDRSYASVGVGDTKRLLAFNGVDVDLLRPGEPERARLRWGLPLDRPLVGIFSQLRPYKGHDVLLQAMPDVVRRVPGAMLVVAGEGPLRRSLERQASNLGLADHVLFLGFQTELTTLYQAVDLVVTASSEEPFGLVTVEAMACGRAVVGTASGGTVDIVEPGVTGLLVPPGSPTPLAEAVVCLLLDSELRRRMGERGRERVEQRFERRQRAALIAEALENLA